MKTVKITIKVGRKDTEGYAELPASYQAPENDAEFQKLIASLSGPALTKAHGDYIRGLDLSVRAANRPATEGAGEPVYVMVGKGGVKNDLRQVALPKLIAGINGAMAGAEMSGKAPHRAITCTRAWLLAEGKVHEKDGVLVAKK